MPRHYSDTAARPDLLHRQPTARALGWARAGARAQSVLLRFCFSALVFAALGLVLATYAQAQNHWLGQSLIWWRELSYGLHASLLFFAAMLVLARDQHLRIDLFYARLSTAARARLDRGFALVFMLPLTLLVSVTALPWAWQAWSRLEASANPSGFAAIYLIKGLLVLAALQGLALALARIAGYKAPPPS